MSDRWVVALAVAAGMGAWWSMPVPGLLVAAAIALAAFMRRPLLLSVAVLCAASFLGARARAGLVAPVDRQVQGWVTLLTDPVRTATAGTRVDARWGDRHVQLWFRGSVATAAQSHAAGERLEIAGRARPATGLSRASLAARHIATLVEVDTVSGAAPADPFSRTANSFRRLVVGGAASLPLVQRGLFAGFVLGDTRLETAEVADNFNASGLTHLMAVSGENVAFVLVAASPLLIRSGRRTRFVLTIAVLAWFGLATRWQPSVLRACAMAAIGAYAALLGRVATGVRILALAATGLLLVDPLLVGSIGFLLSVGAAFGVVMWGRPIGARLPGPRVVAEAAGVTIAAQIGTLPLLLTVFGGVPAVSVVANALAVPAAGPVMVWGLTAGVVAGVLGGTVAWVIHLPDRVLLAWVDTVASRSAALGLGSLRLVHCAVIAAGVCLWLIAARISGGTRRLAKLAGALACVAAVITAAAADAQVPAGLSTRVASRSSLHSSGGVHILELGLDEPARVLASLRSFGVTYLDAVVVLSASRTGSVVAAQIVSRFSPELVLAPAGSGLPGAVHPSAGETLDVHGVGIRIDSVEPGLKVAVLAGSADRGG